MQIKFISLSLTVAVLMTTANAFFQSIGDGAFDSVEASFGAIETGPGSNPAPNGYHFPSSENTSRKKRGLSIPNNIAVALRRRAMARRGEEADEEEEDEDENEDEDEEQDATEEESVADTIENDESANGEEETTEDSEQESSEDVESEDSELERRDSVVGGLPVVGSILGGGQSTGKGSGDILGAL